MSEAEVRQLVELLARFVTETADATRKSRESVAEQVAMAVEDALKEPRLLGDPLVVRAEHL